MFEPPHRVTSKHHLEGITMEYVAAAVIKSTLNDDDLLDAIDANNAIVSPAINGSRVSFPLTATTFNDAVNEALERATPHGEIRDLSVTVADDLYEATRENGPEPLLSVVEAAKMLEITPQAVHKRITAGKLPAVKVGGTWILPLAAVLARL